MQAKYEEEKLRFDNEIAKHQENLQGDNDKAIGVEDKKKKKEKEAQELAEKEAKGEFSNPA